MSEIIPEYIGSRLSNMNDEVVVEASSVEIDPPTENIEQPLFQVPEKQKKKTGMIKKGIKKKKGGAKKLPLNPNAVKASEDQEILTEEVPENLVTDLPAETTEKEIESTSITEGLKKIPSRKKKISKPGAKKRTKKELPKIESAPQVQEKEPELEETPVVEEIEAEVVEKLDVAPEQKVSRSHVDRVKELKPKVETREATTVSSVEERKAYVANIKQETQDFLKRLAEEREQRQLEYEEFRKKLRSDLAKN